MASPTDISGIAHRFRASQVTGYANGASVSSAAFETGGVTLSQATAANQPVYITSSINGQPGLRFNGTSSFITGSVSSAVAQPITISIVMQIADATSSQEILNGGIRIMMNDTAPNTFGVYANGGSELTGGTPSVGAHVFTVSLNSGTATMYVDGTQITNGAASSGSLDGYRLGSYTSGRYFNGDIAEIIVYNKVLSSAERATLDTYIQSTYAITMADATSTTTTSTSRFVRSSDLTSLVLANSGFITANTQTASYTLVRSDVGKVVEMNVAAANTVTIPANASVAFPVGSFIDIAQLGAGQVNVVGASGVTIDAPLGTATKAKYATIRLRQRATNEWVLSGNAAQYVNLAGISGLAHRLRASTIGMTTDGSLVASAPFETGGIVLTASGSAQPVWRASGSNGQPYIRFNGTTTILSQASGIALISQPLTYVIIADFRDAVTSQQVIKSDSEILLGQSTNTYSTYAGTLASGGTILPGTSLLSVTLASSNAQIYANGTMYASASSGGSGFSTSLYIGSHPSTPRYMTADIYEIMIFSQALSTADLQTVHQYAQNMYGTQ